MPDATTMPQSQVIRAAVQRIIRSAIAFGLPYLISWLAQNPDPRWSALGPVIMGVGKYLRSSYPGKFDWLPV